MTYLPQPPAAGPTPGSPGHFAHHDWLEDGLQGLDQAVTAMSGLLVLTTTVVDTLTTAVFSTVSLNTETAREGEWDYSLVGGAVVAGPGWLRGWYRADGAVGIAGQGATATGARAGRVMVNGASPATSPSPVQCQAANGANRPTVLAWTSLLLIAPGDLVTLEARQDSGGNLDTNTGPTMLTLTPHVILGG